MRAQRFSGLALVCAGLLYAWLACSAPAGQDDAGGAVLLLPLGVWLLTTQKPVFAAPVGGARASVPPNAGKVIYFPSDSSLTQRKEPCAMISCLTPTLPSPLAWLAARLQAVLAWFADAAAPEEEEVSAPSRAAVNRQAERLLDTYGTDILRYAYSYLHNRSDAEEVLQDTLLQFLNTAPAFLSPRHEKAWLLRVAGNLSKNRLQYNAVRSTDELKEDLVAEEREDLSFVWEAVSSLPETERAVIHLFYHEGLSTREIAKILVLKESTVRSHLHRARGHLKEILKDAYDF